MTGRLVSNLVDQNKSAGIYNANWNASNHSSGIYIYTLQVFNNDKNKLLYSNSKKCVLMK